VSPHVFCPPSPVNGQPSAIPNPCLPLHKQAKSAIPMEFVSGRWSVVLFSCLQMSSDVFRQFAIRGCPDSPLPRFPCAARRSVSPILRVTVSPFPRVSPSRLSALGAPFPRFSVSLSHLPWKVTKVAASPITIRNRTVLRPPSPVNGQPFTFRHSQFEIQGRSLSPFPRVSVSPSVFRPPSPVNGQPSAFCLLRL